MDRKAHWEQVYASRQVTEVSWYQPEAALSLGLITRHVPALDAEIIDVGSGATVLTARLLEHGYTTLSVLDISGAALSAARARLATGAERVRWIEADVLQAELPAQRFAFWHDRAVFHFLTNRDDQATYARQLRRALAPGGYAMIATFAPDGPLRCSGLDVVRYEPHDLLAVLGEGARLVEAHRETHTTPSGGSQAFSYCLMQL